MFHKEGGCLNEKTPIQLMTNSPSDNMAVTFLDVERGGLRESSSHNTLQQFNSAAPTLNNTPNISRNPSPCRAPSKALEEMESAHTEKPAARSRYFNQELDHAYLGSAIVICFFTSGLIDAVAFNSWSCFVGMQTGNTVFAALGLGGLPQSAHSQQYFKSLAAIGSFCLGTLFFNFLHRYPTGFHNQPISRRRIIFVCSFLIQTLMITVAAALVKADIVSNRPFVQGTFSSGSNKSDSGTNYKDIIPIVILSFEAAGQVCLSRVLSLLELPTIVLSALYHDFVADLYGTRQLWRQSLSFKDFILNQGRRQEKRLVCIIALFLGGIVGGEMYKSNLRMSGALFLAASLKGAITISFLLWRKQRVED